MGFFKSLFGKEETPEETPVEIPTETIETTEPITNFSANAEEKIEPVLEETKMEPETENVAAEEIKSGFDKEKVIDKAKIFLAEVFQAMNIELTVNVLENESEVTFDLVGKDMGILIGKHGQTLDSLQYLTNLAANSHDAEEKIRRADCRA